MNPPRKEHSQVNHTTISGRLSRHLFGRRVGLFMVELLLIVAGILIALAIDSWVRDFRDLQDEVVYLKRLANDLDRIGQIAKIQLDFEKDKVRVGIETYDLLSSINPSAKEDEIGPLLGSLSLLDDQTEDFGKTRSRSDHYQLLSRSGTRCNRLPNTLLPCHGTERFGARFETGGARRPGDLSLPTVEFFPRRGESPLAQRRMTAWHAK